MSECGRIAPLLDALVDGELDEARARAVWAHLRLCPACSRQHEATRQLVEAAGSLEPLEPPPSMWEGLQARLVEQAEEEVHPRWWWWWQAWRRPVLVSAVGVVAVAILTVTFLKDRETPSSVVATRAPSAPSAPSAPVPAKPAALTPAAASPDLYTAAIAEIERADAEYRKAVDELKTAVGEERVRWRPEMARAFDENLATIDAAVTRQREIVKRQPGDPAAVDALVVSYRKEIDFLQEAVVRGDAI